MTNEKKIVVAAIVFFALTITSGCATPTYRGSTASSEMERPLVVASSLRFDDVPIPAGFISIPTESFIYQTENIRAGLLRYEGRSSPETVMQFYKEQMPVYNWQSVNIIEFEKKQLSFEKTGQSCIVIIEGFKNGKSIITISIGPKSEKAKLIK
ncbi:MAG: hypothetical protein Q8R05_05475 [Candidatus Omnitrophota bacterium]|nr:hypothetical protein [Candidatus Omnitrophota bacterium]